jgi:hypothetical protein
MDDMLKMSNGREAAERMLGADSDLVKMKKEGAAAMDDEPAVDNPGAYQMFRKGGGVKKMLKGRMAKKKAMEKSDGKMDGQEVTENQTAIMGKKKKMVMDTDMDGMKKGGKMRKKYAAGGAGKVRKGVMTKDGKPNPNAC